MPTMITLYKGKDRRIVEKGSDYEARIRKHGWSEKPSRTNPSNSSASDPNSEPVKE